MLQYRIVARISLILSILNLVIAIPIVVQEIHEARDDDMVVSEDHVGPAMPEKSGELEAASESDRQASLPTSPDVMAAPQHSSLLDGSTSSGYPSPHLSSAPSVSGYSWLLDRPPRLSPDLPPSLQRSASHPSISGPSEIPPRPHPPDWLQGLAPQIPGSPPAWWQESPSPHPSGSGPSEAPASPHSSVSSEIPPSPQLTVSDWATTETYSPQDRFTPSHHLSSLASTDLMSDESMSTVYSSASGGSLSSHYYSASGESLSSHYYSASEESVPSHHSVAEGLSPSLAPDGPPPSPTLPPTETPPDSVGFFNKNVMKKIKIAAGVTIIGGIIIASITGSQIKNRDCQDS